jgi:GNAT superfamily N-acetyltransferase
MQSIYPLVSPLASSSAEASQIPKADGDQPVFKDYEIISMFYQADSNIEYEFFPSAFSLWPSHLHIDLLPEVQGRGFGVLMIQHLLSQLKHAGSSGVHLEMAASNLKALTFYQKKCNFKIIVEDLPNNSLFLAKEL